MKQNNGLSVLLTAKTYMFLCSQSPSSTSVPYTPEHWLTWTNTRPCSMELITPPSSPRLIMPPCSLGLITPSYLPGLVLLPCPLPQWAFITELWCHQGGTKAPFSRLTLCCDKNGKSSRVATQTGGPTKNQEFRIKDDLDELGMWLDESRSKVRA